MSAQPISDVDPDDPVVILSQLPAKHRDQFLREYYPAAAEAAKELGRYAALRDLLRLWRLRAVMYSDPGYDAALAESRRAALAGHAEGSMTAEEVFGDRWPRRS